MYFFNLVLIVSLTLQVSCSYLNTNRSADQANKKSEILRPVVDDCKNGEVRKGYLQPIVNGLETCVMETQVCQNGQWVGAPLYRTCDNPTEFCNPSHPHGSVQTGFTSPSAPCIQTTRTCIDGNWSRSRIYKFCN